MYALAAVPHAGVLFAACGTGLLRSDDGAASWQPALTALALSAPLPATGVACHDDTVLVGVPGGVLVSHDAGSSWATVLLPDPAPFITALVCSPAFASDGVAWAATADDGVFLTSDGGHHWRAWNIGLFDSAVLCLAASPSFVHDRLLLAGGASGLFVSTNGGRRWDECVLPAYEAVVLSVACLAGATPRLVVGTADHGVFVSPDRGRSWETLATPLGAVNALVAEAAPDGVGRLLALFDDMPYHSHDAGATWVHCPGGAGAVALLAPAGLAPGQPLIVGLADGGITRTALA